MRVAVTILAAGLVQAATLSAWADERDATLDAEAIVVDHMDRMPLAEDDAVVIDHAASRAVSGNDSEAGTRPHEAAEAEVYRPVESRLVRRYRVDAHGRRRVEYDAEERVRRSHVRRVRERDYHHHHHALDGLAVGLALGLPYVAYHNYDRYRPYRHYGHYRPYRHHGYRGHARAHRKYRRHHRRWW